MEPREYEDTAALDAYELADKRYAIVRTAEVRLADILKDLREARDIPVAGAVPDGRDLSIAITHLEDARLRLQHGDGSKD